jgi:guanylate kinase
MKKSSRGTLFIISGPSGAGKGTIRERLFKILDGLSYSISCTTRLPREGEKNDKDYHFISEDEFQRHIDNGDFLEWAGVHGHHYGTLKSDVEKVLSQGKDMFLEIDVQGALQVKKKIPDAVTIFIAPPSLDVLEQRLRGRHTESEHDIELRLRNARKEMEKSSKYDFTLVNDNIERAVTELANFVKQHRCNKER